MTANLLLCAFLVVTQQEPAPEEPSSLPSTSSEPAPTERAQRVRDAVQQATTPSTPAQEAAAPATTETPAPEPAKPTPPPRKPGSFERLIESGPGHYLFYYAPDYLSVGVLGGLTLTSFFFPPPIASKAAFGPAYDPAKRDSSDVNQHQYDRLIGGQYRADTVPAWAPFVVGNAALAGVGLITLVRDRTFRKVHHFVLGAMQAQLATGLTTELMKSAFGRLRPDYRDRMALYYCAGNRGDIPEGMDCTAARREADARGGSHVWLTTKEFEDGRRSFPSGHASSAFSAATYFALFVGGEYVWGENASTATRLPGIAAIVASLTAATFVAGTRVTDNRHHPEDVIVGAGLGAGMAAVFYFLHFDLHGRPLIRSVSFAPVVGGGTLGLNVRGFF